MLGRIIAETLIAASLCGCAATDRPVIDGMLDDPAWEQIPLHLLQQPRGRADAGRAISERGTVRFFHAAGILYVAAEFDDSFLVAAGGQDGDDLYHGDCFELFLKPAGQPSYWEIWISPASLRSVATWRKRGELESTGRLLDGREIDLSVVLRGTLSGVGDDEGWILEAAVPLPDVPEAGTGMWEILLARQNYDGSLSKDTRELSSFPPLSKSDFHRYEEYFKLETGEPH